MGRENRGGRDVSIFLDYYKIEKEVALVSILDESENFHDFTEPDFTGMAEFLYEPGFVVVFGITRAPLEKLIENDPRKEDFALRYRWLDVQAEIRKKTGQRPTLRNLLAGTSGEIEGRYADIERSEYADWSSDAVLNRVEAAHDRLRALKECYDVALSMGEISYYFRDQQFLIDIEWTEPGHPLTIEHTAEGIERTRGI